MQDVCPLGLGYVAFSENASPCKTRLCGTVAGDRESDRKVDAPRIAQVEFAVGSGYGGTYDGGMATPSGSKERTESESSSRSKDDSQLLPTDEVGAWTARSQVRFPPRSGERILDRLSRTQEGPTRSSVVSVF